VEVVGEEAEVGSQPAEAEVSVEAAELHICPLAVVAEAEDMDKPALAHIAAEEAAVAREADNQQAR
jgi:hypothetical protein